MRKEPYPSCPEVIPEGLPESAPPLWVPGIGFTLGIAVMLLLYGFFVLQEGILVERYEATLPLPSPLFIVPVKYQELCFLLPGKGSGEARVPPEERFFAGFPVPLSLATLRMLEALPGIGGGLAKRIYEAKAHTPVSAWEELRVKGVGEKRLKLLKNRFTLPNDPPAGVEGRCFGVTQEG